MSHIQELVEKLINKMSAIFLLLLVSILYLIWTVGLNPPTILFIYDNAAQLVTFFVGCLFLLNLYKVKRNDLFFIAAGILFYLFFSFFRSYRGDTFYSDLIVPTIIAIILIVKWTEFTVIDRSLYLAVFYVFLLVTVYRVFTEIPLPEGQSIWSPSNKLSDIWINTNTIGSSLMTLALLITGFASSFGKCYMRLLSLPALILAGATIWVCQSKAALYGLVIFLILEILPKKIFRSTHLSFWMYAAVSVLALPISYFAAMSDKVHLFTGREEIWRKFYETLGEKTGQIFVGMKPFFFHRGNQILGNHNTYHALVNHYGLIGFALSIILLLSFLWLLVRKCELTNGQLTFLWAFLAIMCQSFMEETLTTISWVPIVFLMLAMATHQYKTTR
ncbi:EpaQ family protein [Enterococcus hirae]|uniref:EpaQ family protein n=1 Tax=Enterococcus hirae TaxID=1354 RepID=UPI0015F2962F|nr:EpaQ family protein [Enterococcus hirae]MBA5252639.1 EpaQ family protein [Enterococcus hirae]